MTEGAQAPEGRRIPETRSHPARVARQARVAALAGYRQLPVRVKRFLVGWMTPSFQVGASLMVSDDRGALLLVRQSYRGGWGFPGGLLKRHEHPSDAAIREVFEELGVDAEPTGPPHVNFDARYRRIDVVFPARLAGSESQEPYPRSAEIREVRWFPIDDLPAMHREAAQALVAAGLLSGPVPGCRSSTWTASPG